MERDTHERGRTGRASDAESLPHLLTIHGQGTPASFEITVDGELELVDADPREQATILSGSTAEGAVEYGTRQFRFSGELTDVTFVNRGGLGPDAVVDPEIIVERDAPF